MCRPLENATDSVWFFSSVFGYENNKPREPSTVTVFPNIVLLEFNAWSYPVIITNPLIWYKHKIEVSKSIVNWGDWLRSTANIKGANKDAKIYFGRSTTVLNLLFYAHTLCMNYVTSTFLLVSSSVRSKQLLCFVQGQGQKSEQKPTTKNFVGFHNHSRLLAMVRVRQWGATHLS